MADIYVVNPTDGNNTRSFSVSPYTTNGETTPVSNVLDASAVSSNTSLLFYGKGKDSYGERIQENFYHLMEHFAHSIEPNNPTHGQVWYDTNDSTLKVFERSQIGIYTKDVNSNLIGLKLKGNEYSLYYQKTKEAALLRFSTGFKFQVFAVNGDSVGEYTVVTSGVDDISNNSDFLVGLNSLSGISTPSLPSLLVNPIPIEQTIGAWKVIQEVDSEILKDILDGNKAIYPTFTGNVLDVDVGNNKLFNLAPMEFVDPVHYAVPKGYLDDNFLRNDGDVVNGNFSVVGILSTSVYSNIDTTLTTLSNGLSTHNHDTDYIEVAGDVMTGDLFLVGNPTLASHAANKAYVDLVVAGVGGIPSLSVLTDVNVSTASNGDFLQYDGVNWNNISSIDAITLNGFSDSEFIKTSTGGTVSNGGVLKLLGQTGQNGNSGIPASEDAVTYQYLNDTVNTTINGLLPNGDIYVIGGSYDGSSDVLTLFQSAGQPNVVISGIASGVGVAINNTTSIGHAIQPLLQGDGDFLETNWSNDPAFPSFTLDSILESLSETVKRMQRRVQSEVIISDGRVTPYDLDVEAGMTYTGGFNGLQVYVNGLKYIANKRGFQELEHATLGIYPSMSTGLNNDPTVYSFNISVDGGSNLLVSFTGDQAQNYRNLVDVINAQMVIGGVSSRAVVFEGVVAFFTDSNGVSSTINISDVNMVSSLTLVSLSVAESGATYDYEEQSEYGNINGKLVQFETPIPISSSIEFISLPVGGATDNTGFEV